MIARVSADRPDDGDDVALRQLGIPAEAIERAVQSGDPERAIFEAVRMPEVASRAHSASDIETAGGLPVAQAIAMIDAFGLPGLDPTSPAFTVEEARAFVELGSFRDTSPRGCVPTRARCGCTAPMPSANRNVVRRLIGLAGQSAAVEGAMTGHENLRARGHELNGGA